MQYLLALCARFGRLACISCAFASCGWSARHLVLSLLCTHVYSGATAGAFGAQWIDRAVAVDGGEPRGGSSCARRA